MADELGLLRSWVAGHSVGAQKNGWRQFLGIAGGQFNWRFRLQKSFQDSTSVRS
jgi:hypothetical protein